MSSKLHGEGMVGGAGGTSRRGFLALGATAFLASAALSGCSKGGQPGASASDTVTKEVAANVEKKSSMEEYSWDEIAAISAKMAAADNRLAALQIAADRGLCTPDGTLDGTQTKSVTLSDGTESAVQIVGFRHDDKSDGTGKAGITFIFKDVVTERGMNSTDITTGGWEASEMRTWLAGEFADMLPGDLAAKIVAVDKMTNNVGTVDSTSAVTKTSDTVWLFSVVELCGNAPWWGGDNYCLRILEAEGSEYQLYTDLEVRDTRDNVILQKTYQNKMCEWWVRSSTPDGRDPYPFHCTTEGGIPSDDHYASADLGVVPGFCI